MHIYRLTQQQYLIDMPETFDFDIHDYFEMYHEHLSDMVGSFINGETLQWHPVSVDRLKPVYKHFTTRNYLDYRDIKAIHSVLKDVISNIARLEVSTALCGHAQESLASLFQDAGYEEYIPEENSEKEEQFCDFMEWQGKCPISDYGLPQLHKILQEIPANCNNPRLLFTILVRLLDVIHQRNDLAAWLIQGGSTTLLELSTME